MPLETDTNLDLLAYWKLKESTWPKLARMAKQYVSSAGVKGRLLCKMHGDPAEVRVESPRRTAPSSTRCLRHSIQSDACSHRGVWQRRRRVWG